MRLAAAAVAALLLALPIPAPAQTELPPVPCIVEDGSWRPLYDCVDNRLQARLDTALRKNALWRKLISRQKMAVGVVDLSDPRTPRFARVNGRAMMYAASLPKIAILLAAYVSIEDGSLPETPELHEDLTAMIRVSSNSAATRVIDLVGMDKIEAVLRDPAYGLYDEERGGGLWVGKRYAQAGERIPDPIKGVSHGATATQVCRFYYLLATGRVINVERSRQMLEHLSDPGLHHKFVGAIEKLAPDAQLFRKSGTWKDWHSDSIMVWGATWRRYILVGLVEDPKGEQILRDLVPVVEDLLRPPELRKR